MFYKDLTGRMDLRTGDIAWLYCVLGSGDEVSRRVVVQKRHPAQGAEAERRRACARPISAHGTYRSWRSSPSSRAWPRPSTPRCSAPARPWRPPTSRRYARKAGGPVHILYNYGNQEIAAVNSSGTPSPKLKATIRVLDFDLKEIVAKTVDFGLLADEVKTIDVLRLPLGLTPTYFLDLRVFKDKGQLVNANFYCLSAKPETLDEANSTWYVTPIKDFADLTALNGLKPVTLKVRDKTTKEGPMTRVTVELENPSADLALMIEIRVVRDTSGETVLPIYLDDNYITLLPNETRKNSGIFTTEDLGGELPVVKTGDGNVRAHDK